MYNIHKNSLQFGAAFPLNYPRPDLRQVFGTYIEFNIAPTKNISIAQYVNVRFRVTNGPI